jgi:hypothetical protein
MQKKYNIFLYFIRYKYRYMISDSALTLALKIVSLSRSSYDKMNYVELQKYLQDYNYKYKNDNFEDAKNILLEAKYYNPLTHMNNFINHNLVFSSMNNWNNLVNNINAINDVNFINEVNDVNYGLDDGAIGTNSNYKSYSYKKEIRSNNGNGYIKEEKYDYNGKDKPTVTSTYRTITNGKIDDKSNNINRTIKN